MPLLPGWTSHPKYLSVCGSRAKGPCSWPGSLALSLLLLHTPPAAKAVRTGRHWCWGGGGAQRSLGVLPVVLPEPGVGDLPEKTLAPSPLGVPG